MVQLPSAARLSGNSKPGLVGRLLHGLQHAAGLDRHRQVGGVDRAHAVHALQAQHHLACRCASGIEPPTRPVLPPCGTMWRRRGAGLHHRGHLSVWPGRTTASALPRERLRQSCSQALTGRPRSARGRRRRMPRSRSMQVQFMSAAARCRRAQPHARARRRPRTAPGTARPRSAPATADSPPVAPGAHHAFGEIEPHQQAHPAVGVHAVAQQAGQRDAQRQHLQRQQCPPGGGAATAPRPGPARSGRAGWPPPRTASVPPTAIGRAAGGTVDVGCMLAS